MKKIDRKLVRGCYDYLIIALAMVVGSLGWVVFLLPHKITIGGLPGISSVVFWATGIHVQYTYLGINILLLAAALKVLGLKFCVKTIYAVSVFTLFTTLWQGVVGDKVMFSKEPFLACVVGGLLLGLGTGFSLLRNGSTGGSDVIAAIVHKYKDISLGHIILMCDLCHYIQLLGYRQLGESHLWLYRAFRNVLLGRSRHQWFSSVGTILRDFREISGDRTPD